MSLLLWYPWFTPLCGHSLINNIPDTKAEVKIKSGSMQQDLCENDSQTLLYNDNNSLYR